MNKKLITNRKKQNTTLRAVYSIILIIALLLLAGQTYAQESQKSSKKSPLNIFSNKYYDKQKKERDDSRFSFYNMMFAREKLKKSGRLMSYYAKGKVSPRIEIHSLGTYYNGWNSSGKTWTGSSYGGSAYLNNFISGILHVTTPNLVLGAVSEFREEHKADAPGGKFSNYGGSIRLFGNSQQDSALFVNFVKTERFLEDRVYREWNWQTGAQLYIAQAMLINGHYTFPNSAWQAIPSNFAKQSGYKAGVAFEIGIFRFGIAFEQLRYLIKPHTSEETQLPVEEKSIRESRRIATVGISL